MHHALRARVLGSRINAGMRVKAKCRSGRGKLSELIVCAARKVPSSFAGLNTASKVMPETLLGERLPVLPPHAHPCDWTEAELPVR